MNDDQFIAAFEDCSLPEAQFDHPGHVRAAFLYVSNYDLNEAIDRIRVRLNAFNNTYGGLNTLRRGYHETVTQAFMRLVYAANQRSGPHAASADFCRAHPELLEKTVLQGYYSETRLWTMAAKQTFVGPDLAPLPTWAGGDRVIAHAQTSAEIEIAKELIREFAESLDFDLCFQGFDEELARLPGAYAAPEGCLLVGYDRGVPTGCVALRPLDDGVCEMKRLWTRPDYRGCGWGRRLAELVMEEARRIGYAQMRLDTIDTMTSAIQLYRTLGFAEIPAYTHNPICGARYFGASL